MLNEINEILSDLDVIVDDCHSYMVETEGIENLDLGDLVYMVKNELGEIWGDDIDDIYSIIYEECNDIINSP